LTATGQSTCPVFTKGSSFHWWQAPRKPGAVEFGCPCFHAFTPIRALQFPHMVTGIEHVAIASPDPLRLALWYVEHLDFVVNYQAASSKTVFIKAADGSMIEIIESAPDTVPAAGMNPAGLRHLALTVADFPGVCARLKEKNVHFLTGPVVAGGNSVVFFTDPEGNVLHLLHRETPLP
jgi:glyoxylase I family protein